MGGHNPDKTVLKITLLLASALIVMVTGVIPPALPSMEAHFAYVPGVALLVRLVLTLPGLSIALTGPAAGFLVDKVGRKPVLVISTCLFGVSGPAGYLAPTLTLLLISRAALGVAVAGLMTSVTTLIADYYTGAARGRFIGRQAAVVGFGGAASVVVGGVLADMGWRVPFLTYSIAIVVLPLIVLAVYEPLAGERCEEKPPPVAGPGQCVAESMRATRSTTLTGAEGSRAPVRFVLFVCAVVFGIQLLFTLIPVQLPFHLQETSAATAYQSGLAISVTSLAYALVSMAYGRTAARLDHSITLSAGFALLGFGYLLMWSAGGWALMLLGLLLAGAGQGLLIPDLSVWMADATGARWRGRVLGGLTTALFLGVFVSPLVGQPLHAAVGFRGLCLIAGALLVGTAAFFWVWRDGVRSLPGGRPSEGALPDPGASGGARDAGLHRSAVPAAGSEDARDPAAGRTGASGPLLTKSQARAEAAEAKSARNGLSAILPHGAMCVVRTLRRR